MDFPHIHGTTMHSLSVLRNACVSALEQDEDEPGRLAEFVSVVDPLSVLELITIVENRLTQEELQALGLLIQDLVTYVSLVPDEKDAAKSLNREELIRRARMLRGITGVQLT